MRDYKEVVAEEWKKFINEDHFPNIMLLGCTGCGKSTLINTIFGKNVARVSDTGRGTDEFKMYYGKDNSSTINLIDSRGYEMGSKTACQDYINEIKAWMNSHKDTKDIVHLVWYCIQLTSDRVQDFDTRVINVVNNDPVLKGKVAVVITMCDQDTENGDGASVIRNIISREVGTDIEVFEVSNNPEIRLDLEKLSEWSAEHIDNEDIRRMFIAAQMVNLNQKRKSASLIISSAVAAAAATGAIPIPGSDAPILTAEQVAMTAAIINCYGLNLAKGVVTALVGDVIISNLGKTLVSNILKCIPGIGSIIGSVISGSVAAAITAALGIAVSEICYSCCKRIANGETIDFAFEMGYSNIKDIMEQWLKKNGKKSTKDIEDIVRYEGDKK